MTVRTLNSVAYCYVYSLALPYFLIPAISTTHVHPPTLVCSVSVPASLNATRGHLPTWASLVSVPAYRLPTHNSSPFQLRSYYMPISPPLLLLLLAYGESSRVAQSFFLSTLGVTIPYSSTPLLHTMSPLHIPQIRDVAPRTAPQLPAVALCKSYLTGFLLPLV